MGKQWWGVGVGWGSILSLLEVVVLLLVVYLMKDVADTLRHKTDV